MCFDGGLCCDVGVVMGAADILKMIETVSPDDTAKLDEIDARVDCYKWGYDFHDVNSVEGCFVSYFHKGPLPEDKYGNLSQKYTRSRDALKAIRPEGWWFGICGAYWCDFGKKLDERKPTPELPTEELAELHAIIQAIEYERTK